MQQDALLKYYRAVINFFVTKVSQHHDLYVAVP